MKKITLIILFTILFLPGFSQKIVWEHLKIEDKVSLYPVPIMKWNLHKDLTDMYFKTNATEATYVPTGFIVEQGKIYIHRSANLSEMKIYRDYIEFQRPIAFEIGDQIVLDGTPYFEIKSSEIKHNRYYHAIFKRNGFLESYLFCNFEDTMVVTVLDPYGNALNYEEIPDLLPKF